MFMYSCESKESQSLYELNKELLVLRCKKKKSFFYRVKVLLSYIFQGYFKRLLKYFFGKKTKTSYSLKEYARYPNKKVAIYTCLFGKYDRILEPLYINQNADYYIITDQAINKNSIWKKMDLPNDQIFKTMSPIEKNRYFKTMPHVLFGEYDYSIYVDANVLIVTDLFPLICDCGEKVIGIHNYPLTDCIYEMGKSIIAGKKASKKDVKIQLSFYKKNGFPKHYGAFECNIIVRKHNDLNCIKLMEDWWKDFNSFKTKRDQLSFMYALWKNNYTKEFVCPLGDNVRLNPRFQVLDHIHR